MKPQLNDTAEIVAKANDAFTKKHQHIDTLMGIMDKALRSQGIAADAITIDAIALDKKIVFLLPDTPPNIVEVALGNRQGDIYKKYRLAQKAFNIERIMNELEHYFLHSG